MRPLFSRLICSLVTNFGLAAWKQSIHEKHLHQRINSSGLLVIRSLAMGSLPIGPPPCMSDSKFPSTAIMISA